MTNQNVIELQDVNKTFNINHEKTTSVFEYLTTFYKNKKGKILGKYRKIHLIGIGGFRETDFFSPGKNTSIIKDNGAREPTN